MTQEKILDRIRKLYAKAESLKQMGNEAEAASFAAKVQEMLVQHKLEMSDMELENQERDDPMNYEIIEVSARGKKKVSKPWRIILAMSVAEAHYCRVLSIPKSSRIVIIGRESDRKIAEYMILTLSKLAEDQADKHYVDFFYRMRDQGRVEAARGFRQGFITGFVHTIRQRYQDEIRIMRNQAVAKGLSLIPLDRAEMEVQDAYHRLINQMGAKDSKISLNSSSSAGYAAGSKVGQQANLRANAMNPGQKPASHQRLGLGQKLLGGGQ